MNHATKFPCWKNALENFKFNYGDVIPHSWFYENFNLHMRDAPKVWQIFCRSI